jgi:RNA polymerase sigma factor (sigma-70 family)
MRSDLEFEERFNALYRAHRAAVLRYACRRTDPDTARDVVAETFLVAWRKHSAIPGDPDEIEPWLYGVARRVLANAERSARRYRLLAVRLGQVSRDGQVPDPATAITERERLIQALRRLPSRDQEALRLVGWEELDLTGAALAMGCSPSAMAARLYRARRKLAVALTIADRPGRATGRATGRRAADRAAGQAGDAARRLPPASSAPAPRQITRQESP